MDLNLIFVKCKGMFRYKILKVSLILTKPLIIRDVEGLLLTDKTWMNT